MKIEQDKANDLLFWMENGKPLELVDFPNMANSDKEGWYIYYNGVEICEVNVEKLLEIVEQKSELFKDLDIEDSIKDLAMAFRRRKNESI